MALLVEPLLRLLWPASGREPAPCRRPSTQPRPRRPSSYKTLLHGEDSRLVRPYLFAHEQRAQVRQQRARRRTLWLAVHGIDVGPRRIHGVDVGSHRNLVREAAVA
ncbi:hypothetical protein FSY75_33580 [Streptomyces sp. TR1341]|nr:hypothetical protein [Streptomyces sp. TR1341]